MTIAFGYRHFCSLGFLISHKPFIRLLKTILTLQIVFMKRFTYLLLPGLMLTLLFSCKKNEDGEHNTVTPGAYRTLDEAVASTAPIARSTSISVSSGDTSLTAANGTRFIFPPNAFETLNGGKVTGSVQVTIQDWLKKGDMFFGKVQPLSYGEPLESGGEAFVQITQNGEVLRLKPGLFITVKFPQFGLSGPSFSGYKGRTIIGSQNTVNWIEDMDQITASTLVDTVAVKSDTLHYVQAAVPFPFNGYNNFTVTMTTPVTLEQSLAVVLYDGHKAMYPLESAIDNIVHAQHVPSAPLHLVVMGINAGNFYGGIVAIPAPGTDSTYQVIIKNTTPASLRLQMNNL